MTGRKSLLPGLLAGLALSACGANSGFDGGTPPPPGDGDKLSVVVVVLDSLMPSDLDSGLMPNLQALVDAGTVYEQSRAVFSAETIPNHVAMMTGVVPARSGIPTNNFWDKAVSPDAATDEDLSLPKELTAHTLFTHIANRCPNLSTGAALSKKYLFEIFCGDEPAAEGDLSCADLTYPNDNPATYNRQPDNYWDPTSSPVYLPSPDEHTPDIATMQEALAQLPDSDFLFINLGDIDRSAHAAGAEFRLAVSADTDLQLGLLVDALQSSGRWDNTVMLVVSDHGMDYSPLGLDAINVQPALDALAACGYEPMFAVDNGGTDSLYVTNLAATEEARRATLRAARACLVEPDGAACAAVEGVCGAIDYSSSELLPRARPILAGWYTQADPADPDGSMPASIMSAHENLGDLVLVAADGIKFSERNLSANPIPGNHGHLETLHNFMLVTGGSSLVRPGVSVAASVADPGPLDRLPEQSENIDVAPTVAWLLGLNLGAGDFPDGGGFDGRVLSEAFTAFETSANPAPPSRCGVLSGS